jgi:LacI family transcriptional regulator
MKTSLKDFALSLGLSPTTVSRALAGYPDVSPATRQRVVEAARSAGYRPDPTARRLVTGRADAVGMIVPFGANRLGNPRFVDVVGGLANSLADRDMDLMILAARPGAELDTYRRHTSARSVDALIVADTLIDDARIAFLQREQFPFVAYGRTNTALPYPWFDFDNEAGAKLAVQRLAALGHRRIALIHGPRTVSFVAQRLAGFVAGMRDAGLADMPRRTVEVALDRAAGRAAMAQLLAGPERPTAVIVDNNLAGVGAIRALDDAGVRPGRDISLIVYGVVPTDILLPYRVTTIAHPTGEATGRMIAQLVVGAIAGEPAATLQRLEQPVLQPGDTDGPLPM